MQMIEADWKGISAPLGSSGAIQSSLLPSQQPLSTLFREA
jgi:hypothetical protein